MLKRITSAALTAILLCGCAPAPTLKTEPTTQPTAQTTPTTAPTTQPTQPTTVPTEPEQPPTLLELLTVATQPVGNTMYIWGGGWNEEDTGAGIEAVTIGVSPQWAQFAAQQDSSYDYNTTRYQIHNGLDCSGYVGWTIYNVLETENGGEGYVCASTEMARSLADRGFGAYIPAEEMTHWQPGDIMSQKGHCWIVVGMCDDGSVLLLHSSPPGVRFCGTLLPDGTKSQAVSLAETVMKEQYPQWHSRYPDCSSAYNYLTKASALRWNEQTLSDPENLRHMTAQQILSLLFP